MVENRPEPASLAGAVREEGVDLHRAYEALVGDIDQLKELIDDATSGLTTTFAAVADMTNTIAALAGATSPADAERGANLVQSIGRQVQNAAIHLQFHDLASQVLANMRQRLEALESGTGDGAQSRVEGAARARVLEERRPTDLQVRAGGDVDLF